VISLAARPAIALDSLVERLDLEKMFGRIAPLHVDLGCGDGSFLCELAQKHPEKNFLGIERLSGRVEKTRRKATKIDNVRVLQIETDCAVRYLLPPGSVETFYLLFPDPWPKRRHHRRRIVTPEFLDSIHAALEKDGVLHITTDHRDYFRHIECLAHAASQERPLKLDRFNRSSFARFEVIDLDETDLPFSKFEKRFRAQGAPIYRLSLRKTSPVT
jgi:tRNA (guanine-N7-)-methyltransferase